MSYEFSPLRPGETSRTCEEETMNEKTYRVSLYTLEPSFKPLGLILDEEQLRELTSAMNYGSGWFPYRDGGETIWFNLHGIASVIVKPMEKE